MLGTSASAPIFAAIISHLNVERLARGMPPMGFINPWLCLGLEMDRIVLFNRVVEGQPIVQYDLSGVL